LIWIIGGTSEASELISKIRGRKNYVVTVATYSGREVLKDNNVVVSRLTREEMVEFIKNKSITMVVDMSHPYAVEVTGNAKYAADCCGVEYLRYVRENSDLKDAIQFSAIDECKEFLRNIRGCVFFTTGMKNIKDFQEIRGSNKYIYRVLPTVFSIEECVKNNIEMKDIVAVLGPVSEELNIAMFKEYGADYVVMKDSGEKGGTREKISACKALGIVPIVIGRKQEFGISCLEELVEMIK
jgi:precorrin-6A/cobalt-precorrin-6A reductase